MSNPKLSEVLAEPANVLALDTATLTGWAMRLGQTIHSGTQSFQHDAKRESQGMRFLRFSKWLRSMIQDHKVKLVCYEQPHQRGGAATTVAVGLTTHLMSVCEEYGVQYAAVHTATLKLHATGKGNAGKGQMEEAAKAAGWWHSGMDDNEVDARWLLHYAEEHLI